MTFLIGIFKLLLNFIYLFFKLFKTRDQITLISRQGNEPSEDFVLLSNQLKKELKGYKTVVLCKTMDNKISYAFHIFVQMYNIARSKIVILDSYCITVSVLKHKKTLKVIQIWHAIGLMKKAGYAILDKEEGRSSKMARAMNMHKNYDYVFTSSVGCIPYLAQVFGCDEKKVYSVPLPRIDLLKDEKLIKQKKESILRDYPILKDKINILYAPTQKKGQENFQKNFDELCNAIDYSKYNLIAKFHILTKLDVNNKNVLTCDEYSTDDMMYVCEFVISDYSSVIYDAGVLNKKQIFFAFDWDEYKENRDVFVDYEKEMPGPILKTAKEVVDFIDNPDYTPYENIDTVAKYVDLTIDNYSENMVMQIKRILEGKDILQ